jgi:hypothetical protein
MLRPRDGNSGAFNVNALGGRGFHTIKIELLLLSVRIRRGRLMKIGLF